MTLRAQIVVSFVELKDGSEGIPLATLDYVANDGRIPSMVVEDAKVKLPDGSVISVNSAWTPDNNMVSLIVLRNGREIAHSGNCWHLGDPYLGIAVEGVGYLCFNLTRQHPSPDAKT